MPLFSSYHRQTSTAIIMSSRNKKKTGRNLTRLEARERVRERCERETEFEENLNEEISNIQKQAAEHHNETKQNFTNLDSANQKRHEEAMSTMSTFQASAKKLGKKLEIMADHEGLLKKSEADEEKLQAEKAARKKEAALKKEMEGKNRELTKKLEEEKRRAAAAKEEAAKAKKDRAAAESTLVAATEKLELNGLSPVAASNAASRASTFNHTQHKGNVDRGITKMVNLKMKAKDLKKNPKSTF